MEVVETPHESSFGAATAIPVIVTRKETAHINKNDNSTGGRRWQAPLRCKVSDCTSDLASAPKTHQRFRLCNIHIKAPVISVDGVPSRFCQQCSRFHSLEEFFGTNRTCEMMLAKNRARQRNALAPAASERRCTSFLPFQRTSSEYLAQKSAPRTPKASPAFQPPAPHTALRHIPDTNPDPSCSHPLFSRVPCTSLDVPMTEYPSLPVSPALDPTAALGLLPSTGCLSSAATSSPAIPPHHTINEECRSNDTSMQVLCAARKAGAAGTLSLDVFPVQTAVVPRADDVMPPNAMLRNVTSLDRIFDVVSEGGSDTASTTESGQFAPAAVSLTMSKSGVVEGKDGILCAATAGPKLNILAPRAGAGAAAVDVSKVPAVVGTDDMQVAESFRLASTSPTGVVTSSKATTTSLDAAMSSEAAAQCTNELTAADMSYRQVPAVPEPMFECFAAVGGRVAAIAAASSNPFARCSAPADLGSSSMPYNSPLALSYGMAANSRLQQRPQQVPSMFMSRRMLMAQLQRQQSWGQAEAQERRSSPSYEELEGLRRAHSYGLPYGDLPTLQYENDNSCSGTTSSAGGLRAGLAGVDGCSLYDGPFSRASAPQYTGTSVDCSANGSGRSIFSWASSGGAMTSARNGLHRVSSGSFKRRRSFGSEAALYGNTSLRHCSSGQTTDILVEPGFGTPPPAAMAVDSTWASTVSNATAGTPMPPMHDSRLSLVELPKHPFQDSTQGLLAGSTASVRQGQQEYGSSQTATLPYMRDTRISQLCRDIACFPAALRLMSSGTNDMNGLVGASADNDVDMVGGRPPIGALGEGSCPKGRYLGPYHVSTASLSLASLALSDKGECLARCGGGGATMPTSTAEADGDEDSLLALAEQWRHEDASSGDELTAVLDEQEFLADAMYGELRDRVSPLHSRTSPLSPFLPLPSLPLTVSGTTPAGASCVNPNSSLAPVSALRAVNEGEFRNFRLGPFAASSTGSSSAAAVASATNAPISATAAASPLGPAAGGGCRTGDTRFQSLGGSFFMQSMQCDSAWGPRGTDLSSSDDMSYNMSPDSFATTAAVSAAVALSPTTTLPPQKQQVLLTAASPFRRTSSPLGPGGGSNNSSGGGRVMPAFGRQSVPASAVLGRAPSATGSGMPTSPLGPASGVPAFGRKSIQALPAAGPAFNRHGHAQPSSHCQTLLLPPPSQYQPHHQLQQSQQHQHQLDTAGQRAPLGHQAFMKAAVHDVVRREEGVGREDGAAFPRGSNRKAVGEETEEQLQLLLGDLLGGDSSVGRSGGDGDSTRLSSPPNQPPSQPPPPLPSSSRVHAQPTTGTNGDNTRPTPTPIPHPLPLPSSSWLQPTPTTSIHATVSHAPANAAAPTELLEARSPPSPLLSPRPTELKGSNKNHCQPCPQQQQQPLDGAVPGSTQHTVQPLDNQTTTRAHVTENGPYQNPDTASEQRAVRMHEGGGQQAQGPLLHPLCDLHKADEAPSQLLLLPSQPLQPPLPQQQQLQTEPQPQSQRGYADLEADAATRDSTSPQSIEPGADAQPQAFPQPQPKSQSQVPPEHHKLPQAQAAQPQPHSPSQAQLQAPIGVLDAASDVATLECWGQAVRQQALLWRELHLVQQRQLLLQQQYLQQQRQLEQLLQPFRSGRDEPSAVQPWSPQGGAAGGEHRERVLGTAGRANSSGGGDGGGGGGCGAAGGDRGPPAFGRGASMPI